MRKRLILSGLALTVIVAGVIALAAFTAQVVNLTAHVEKDIAVEPVICAKPGDIDTPCFVDPRGGNFGVTLPQEFYERTIEVTLSNSFFEQDRFNDLAFDILWECKNIEPEPTSGNLCRDEIVDDSICAIDLDVPPDGLADTIQHCDDPAIAGDGAQKLDDNIRDHITITPFLNSALCFVPLSPGHTPKPPEKEVEYVATGFLDKVNHKCRYELKFFTPPCIGGFNIHTDPHELAQFKKPIDCHKADKDRDGNPDLKNPQDFDEFADLGDDFKIQVFSHSLQPCGGVLDICVDADGFNSPLSGLPGAAEVVEGDTLDAFGQSPCDQFGGPRSFVDMFDNDNSGTWTAGDDLHNEDPLNGGNPNAIHDAGVDPVILDINGSLFNGQFVDVDLDGFLGSLPNPPLVFFDTNGDNCWQNGEDIILDVNNNKVFD